MPKLVRLSVENFRSHHKQLIDLADRTVIVGPNGIGKTNLLEALWLLATSRSFRTSHLDQVINWEAEAARIQVDDFEIVLVRVPQLTKILKIRGVPRRPIEYLGSLRAVIFTPDTYRMLIDGPPERRQFLDIILAQQDSNLARLLVRYRQIIKQRNSQLRLIRFHDAPIHDLAIWDEQLIEAGLAITEARTKLIEQLTPIIKQSHRSIGGLRAPDIELIYRPSSPENTDLFWSKLASLREREIASQISLVGPHRDNFTVELAGRPAEEYASRGELRRVLLAIKWAEVVLLGQSDKPLILLLDDVFSEFDAEHRSALLELIGSVQTVLTTTETSHLPSDFINHEASVIDLEMSITKGVNGE